MPFAPAADPDLAARLMFAGISQAGQGLAAGLQAALEKHKNKTKERKHYLGLGETLVAAGEMDENTFENLRNAPTDAIKGTIDGLKMGSYLKAQRQEQQIRAEQLRSYGDQRKFNEAFASAPGQSETGDPSEPTMDERLSHALREAPGGLSPDHLAQMLRYSGSAAGGQPGEFVQDPVTGQRFFGRGNTTLPSGIDPSKAGTPGGQPAEEMLSNGKGSGWARFPDGKYRRLPNTKDTLDAAKYDTDGDGILSQQEFVNALMGEKAGGLAPGMRVAPGSGGKAAPSAPQSGPSYEGFKEWQKGRK
jgi:hypothetical protein